MSTGHDRRGDGQDFQQTAARVLEHLHATVGLDMWAMGRRQGDDWVVLSSAGADLNGLQLAWSDTLCARVHEGLAEWATPDVDQVPCLVAARDVIGLPVRSFVTVPLHSEAGELLGTLCGAGTAPAGADLADCRPQMDVFADVLASLLAVELRLEREARQREVAEIDARTDPLTGLGNRRRWDQQLAAEEDRCRRYGSTATVLTIDVDGLKAVNDLWGHDAGDAMLRQVADVLRRECRPGDVVARLGGDEFAVLLAEVGSPEAEAVAERLRAALVAANAPASLGIAVRGRAGLVEAWRAADALMYEHKRAAMRSEPLQPPVALPQVDPVHDAVVTELLSLVLGQTGADIAFIGRFEGPHRVVRAIRSVQPVPVGPGHAELLSSTYCQKMVSGELPSAIPDTSRNPVAAALPVTKALPIGAYLGVPLHLADGRLYGTLCCLSHTARTAFGDDAVAFLRQVGEGLSRVLSTEEQGRAGRRRMLARIDDLLAREAVEMTFQPVVDLASGAVQGAEALARFEDGRSAAQWFADAATVERTHELELHTARLALETSTGWQGDLWLNLSASVMVSPAAASLLAGKDLSHLVLEISEHEQVADYDGLRRVLVPWRERGLRLAVDDAGAGFSSLRHVLELMPDVIKLDISLVQGLPSDPTRRALVAALVSFAAQAGAAVVAEGVESDAELDALRGTGVLFAQGFHLGVPLPSPQHEQRLRSAVPDPRSAQAPALS
ncbi:MAG: EAL domain-containing protein [Mycobacteriales bacterium]